MLAQRQAAARRAPRLATEPPTCRCAPGETLSASTRANASARRCLCAKTRSRTVGAATQSNRPAARMSSGRRHETLSCTRLAVPDGPALTPSQSNGAAGGTSAASCRCW